jgi:hypothetical protein
VIRDDTAVDGHFAQAQKCWAPLRRNAIKRTRLDAKNAEYRRLTDRLLEIRRAACRVQQDRRYGDAGRAQTVAELEDEILELCSRVRFAELPPLESPDDDRLLCNEIMKRLLAEERFTFVTAATVRTPNGKGMSVGGTNHEVERTLRSPAQARDTGRTCKTVRGARRQSVIVSVLESLRQYLPSFTLSSVIQEILRWHDECRSCFAKQRKKLKLTTDALADNLLDRLLPIPADSSRRAILSPLATSQSGETPPLRNPTTLSPLLAAHRIDSYG